MHFMTDTSLESQHSGAQQIVKEKSRKGKKLEKKEGKKEKRRKKSKEKKKRGSAW
jgi:hypothetical protein